MSNSAEIERNKTYDGVNYELRELRLRDVEDLLGKEGVNFSVELFKRAVYVDGQPIGDAAGDLPIRIYTKLARIVTQINAGDDDEAQAGNE